jgi:hypothetical protein
MPASPARAVVADPELRLCEAKPTSAAGNEAAHHSHGRDAGLDALHENPGRYRRDCLMVNKQ